MVRANKKGVIRIIEAIIAVLILLGVVLTLLSRQPIKVDFASSVYKVETQILNEIEGKNNLRTAVLNFDKKTIDCFISSRLEKYALDFNTTICNALTEACFCSGAPSDKEVYSADVLISTNVTEQQLNFKKLLICAWIGKMSARTCAFCGNSKVEISEDCDPTTSVCSPVYNANCASAQGCIYCSSNCKNITVAKKCCGDGTCNSGETCSSCSADCGACPVSCGDGACNGGETCSSCPGDCGSCPPTQVCGNNFREGTEVCDDGNTISCDGCKGDCLRYDKVCGDGIVECGEVCAPTICQPAGGQINFGMSAGKMTPYQLSSNIRYLATSSLTTGQFRLRVYYNNDIYQTGPTRNIPTDLNQPWTDLPWPLAGSVITIEYSTNNFATTTCQARTAI
jgi:cysteine-rich repeat protein